MSQILLIATRATQSASRSEWVRGLIVAGCGTALILARAPILL